MSLHCWAVLIFTWLQPSPTVSKSNALGIHTKNDDWRSKTKTWFLTECWTLPTLANYQCKITGNLWTLGSCMQYTPKFSERWAMPRHWPTANVKLQAILPITNVKLQAILPITNKKTAGNLANHNCKIAGNLWTLTEARCSIQQVLFSIQQKVDILILPYS